MKKAFTLLELLVAVVIVGLLLAILFPALGRVREAARRAQCMNNLRQHGIAWYLYLDDHDECFPVYGPPSAGGGACSTATTFGGKQGPGGGGAKAQYRVLNSYLDIYSDDDKAALEIFHCPNDIKGLAFNGNAPMFNFFGTSYRLNPTIIKFGEIVRPRPLSTITSPRNKVYLEICNEWSIPGHGGKGKVGHKTPVMVLFVDGHVAGPFLFDDDFEPYDPNTDKPAIEDPNGTLFPLWD